MPITNFRFVQPYSENASDPTYHEWQQIIEDVNGNPDLNNPLEAYETAANVWLNCTEDQLVEIEYMCQESLTVIDNLTGISIPPTQNEILLCVADNASRCFGIDVFHPEPNGWIMVRACEGTSCSSWTTTSIPEPGFGMMITAGLIMLGVLGKVNGNRRRWLSR